MNNQMKSQNFNMRGLYLVGILVNFISAVFIIFICCNKPNIFGDISDGISVMLCYVYFFFLSFFFYIPYFFLKRKNLYIEKRRYLILFSPCLFYTALIVLYCYLLENYNYDYPLKLSMFVPCILLNLAYNFIVKTIIERKIEQQT